MASRNSTTRALAFGFMAVLPALGQWPSLINYSPVLALDETHDQRFAAKVQMKRLGRHTLTHARRVGHHNIGGIRPSCLRWPSALLHFEVQKADQSEIGSQPGQGFLAAGGLFASSRIYATKSLTRSFKSSSLAWLTASLKEGILP